MGQNHSRKTFFEIIGRILSLFKSWQIVETHKYNVSRCECLVFYTYHSNSSYVKKVELTENWDNLSSELAFGSLREEWFFFHG